MNVIDSSWYEVVVNSLTTKGLVSPLGDMLPSFPSEEMQRNTTGLAGDAAVRQAFFFYDDIVAHIGRSGGKIGKDWDVLDFGIGWGRIARMFLGRVSAGHIHGVDVDPDFIALTRELFPEGDFRICEAFPPTSFADGSMHLVSAYSVFSHLSEASARAWIDEFARILAPGGYVAFTTRDPSFFGYLEWARGQGDKVEGYTRALGSLFADIDEARRRYDAGHFVHATSVGVSGGGPRNETFYGESFIPPSYVKKHLSEHFELAAMSFDPARYDQRFFLLRKRAAG